MHINKLNGNYIIELTEIEHDYFEKEMRDMDEELVKLRQENKMLESQRNNLLGLLSGDNFNDSRKLYDEKERLRSAVIYWRDLYYKRDEENEELKQKLDESKHVKLDVNIQLALRKASLEVENEKIRGELDDLQTKYKQLETQRDNLIEHVKYAERRGELSYWKMVNNNNEEVEKLKEQLKKMRISYEALSNHTKGAFEENEMLRDELDVLSYEKDRLRKQVAHYMNLYFNEVKENEALKEELFEDEVRTCKELIDKLNAIEAIITGEEE